MTVVVTGSSNGIGEAIVRKFIMTGHTVYGIDVSPDPPYLFDLSTEEICRYHHYRCDVRDRFQLPAISEVDILINNAGIQEGTENDDTWDFSVVDVNLKGTINCTEAYGLQRHIKSIINIASVSAHTGAEFPRYCASKGGMLSYTRSIAKKVAVYGARCNSISPGGVTTHLNDAVMNDEEMWKSIMDKTPLKKWASPEDIAEWVYFLCMADKNTTGQDIIIDNGECLDHTFVWPNI